MRKYSLIALCLLCQAAFSQELKFSLSGNITECMSKIALPGATVKLVGSDNTSVETKTDSAGNYQFDEGIVKPNTSYVVSANGQDIRMIPEFPDGVLGNPKGRLTTVGIQISTEFKQDFCLKRLLRCGWRMPTILFPKNSDSLTRDQRSELEFAYKIMTENPNITIELGAHSSYDESSQQLLSYKRAKHVVDYLITEKGIDPERITPVGYGISKATYIDGYYDTLPSGKTIGENTQLTREFIEQHYLKTKNKKDREYLLHLNRRVTFSILRKDYVKKTTEPQK